MGKTTEPDELTPIEQAEAAYGFRFGRPDDIEHDDAGTPEAAALACTQPGCSMLNQMVTIHADTVLPVHCGGWITPNPTSGETQGHPCHTVLHCDHPTQQDKSVTVGTISHPFRIDTTVCLKCATVLTTTKTELPPTRIEDLPIGILDTLK